MPFDCRRPTYISAIAYDAVHEEYARRGHLISWSPHLSECIIFKNMDSVESSTTMSCIRIPPENVFEAYKFCFLESDFKLCCKADDLIAIHRLRPCSVVNYFLVGNFLKQALLYTSNTYTDLPMFMGSVQFP